MKSSRWALAALLLAIAVLPALAQTAKPRTTGTPGAARPAAPRTAPAARPVPRPAASAASAQHLDGIAAVVNDEVVLQSDVEEQVYLFVMRNQLRPDSTTVDTLRRQVLDEMINEKLVVAEAKRQGLVVSDAEVNREVEKAIQEARDRLGRRRLPGAARPGEPDRGAAAREVPRGGAPPATRAAHGAEGAAAQAGAAGGGRGLSSRPTRPGSRWPPARSASP